MASRKELLARYGDAAASKPGSEKDKKKKKKKSKKQASNVFLIDNDVLVAQSKRRKTDVIDDGEQREIDDDEQEEEARPTIVTDLSVPSAVEERERALLEERLARKRAEALKVWKTERDENASVGAIATGRANPDASPPRRRHDSPDASPPRKRHDSPDASPPRKRHDSPDASPPRKRHDSPDASPPRKRHDSPDASPPRKRHDSPDASPPRKRHDSPVAKKSSKKSVPKDEEPMVVEAITDRRGRKLEMLSEMQGGAKSVESQYEWGGGIKEDKKKNEPPPSTFTVSIDDAERDAKLKDAMRWGDPMAGMVFRKTEHHKSSKKSKKDAPSGPQLEYQGKVQYPNRFNIKPGVAWDGRDRSNGFEARYFAHKNAAKAVADSQFAWSVNDL